MRQSKTLILSTNVDKKSLVAEICRQTMAVENTVSSDFLSAFMRGSRGGVPTLTTFFKLMRGEERIQIPQ